VREAPPPPPLLTADDVDRLPLRALPGFIVELAALQARAAARLRQHDAAPDAADAPDRLLNVRDAAALLCMSVDWLYRHKDRLPFTRPTGRRTVRFSEAGIRRWLAHRR
jgi:predicted DNA-binding transcriptional regulator AlpA